jgi:hypothetical protein
MQIRVNTIPEMAMKGLPYPSGRRPILAIREEARPSLTEQNILGVRYMNCKESNVREGMAT